MVDMGFFKRSPKNKETHNKKSIGHPPEAASYDSGVGFHSY